MNSLQATDPRHNATVSASAGSGKTWLLVTRILRLLLDGASPGNILALTFTRKAATEMAERLDQRLLEMATAPDAQLGELLLQAGADDNEASRTQARQLYDRVLASDYPVRMQTFHAFCQDILARFSMEADVPPGFELIADTSLLQQQVWDQLFSETTRDKQSATAQSLLQLMDACNGPVNTRTALNNMLAHRSDWWAFTHAENDAVSYAAACLADRLEISPGDSRYLEAFFEQQTAALQRFCHLLGKHATKTYTAALQLIQAALAAPAHDTAVLQDLAGAFLTAKGEPRKDRKHSKTLVNKLGEDGTAEFVALNEQLTTAIVHALDLAKRHASWQLNQAWYQAGDRYIQLFQQIKRERRLLDFTDLEWKCYELLRHEDNTLWVQYKLDQRIDHILIDEFQDTNPTQWQLLLPLLEEMAASDNLSSQAERRRSAFLVGDEKQSIYSFRRANPALQAVASDWLQSRLAATAVPMDRSWRSSPAIMDYVNAVFTLPEIAAQMPGFTPHDTHQQSLAGSVTLFPETLASESEISNAPFRDPLRTPRLLARDDAREQEARYIAEEILSLHRSGAIEQYNEVMILLRKRRYIPVYEQVFRQYQLPFISDRRGGLLDNLEVQDMECLLDVLLTPFNNLALAQVLKSPLFAATDDDLLALQRHEGHGNWHQRLQQLADEADARPRLQQAAVTLRGWRQLADTLPVHDLFEQIYHEQDVIARYTRAAGERARQVSANLHRFLELTLEVESGRYPSLSQFRHYLHSMREHAEDQLNLPDSGDSTDNIRIYTIHASKGLEAPVVFLADSNNTASKDNAWNAIVDWPETATRPRQFQLQVDKQATDSITRQSIDWRQQQADRENLNLLYVAITRARQHLYLSASAAGRNKAGWYAHLAKAMATLVEPAEGAIQRYSYTADNTAAAASDTEARQLPLKTVSLQGSTSSAILPAQNADLIAPSRIDHTAADIAPAGDKAQSVYEARIHGLAVHRLLDLMTRNQPCTGDTLLQHLALEYDTWLDTEQQQAVLQEAQRTVASAALADLFAPVDGARCYNELPLLFDHEGQGVYGIADRVVVTADQVIVADYKSQRIDTGAVEAAAGQFRQQLALYAAGVSRVFSCQKVRCCVVFTRSQQRVWL